MQFSIYPQLLYYSLVSPFLYFSFKSTSSTPGPDQNHRFLDTDITTLVSEYALTLYEGSDNKMSDRVKLKLNPFLYSTLSPQSSVASQDGNASYAGKMP